VKMMISSGARIEAEFDEDGIGHAWVELPRPPVAVAVSLGAVRGAVRPVARRHTAGRAPRVRRTRRSSPPRGSARPDDDPSHRRVAAAWRAV
jgi:hypothetical protein